MITLALIGVGQWGLNYLKTIRGIKGCQLKYLCSPSIELKKNITGEYLKLKDYRQLYKYKDIDGVIIATPAGTHYKIASIFLKRGYNLLVEKPLTTNYQDALALKELQRKNKNSIFMVGHIYLYHPAFLKLLEVIKNIGQIKYLDFEGCDWGPFRTDVSTLWDWTPHDISMCLEIMKHDPLEVSAWEVGSGMVYLRLRFKNNVFAFIKNGWLSPEKKRKVTVVGTRGSVIFDDTRGQKIKHIENIGSVSCPFYSQEPPLKLEILEFTGCIQTKKKPKTDFAHALKVIKIIHFAQESMKNSGKIIKI